MARITKGLLGGFSGKIGPVVGYTLYGVDRMRSLPDRTAPPTENELKNRSQFKLVQDTLNPIKELLKAGFKNYWTVSGGTRAALSYNRKFAVKATEEGYEIDPEQFKISGGSLPGLTGLRVLQESAEVLRFHWNPEDVPGGSRYDQVMLLAMDLQGQKSCYECPGNFRSAGTGMLQLSEDLSGKEVDVYIAVVAKDRSVQSDSQYLGRIQLKAGAVPVLNTEMKPVIPELEEDEPMEEDQMIPDQKNIAQALSPGPPLFYFGEPYFKKVEQLFLQRPGIELRNEKNWEDGKVFLNNEIRARLLNTDERVREWLNNRGSNNIKDDI
ncbi:hypothetical protein SAMN05421820_101714 [Pedobacter steynii]|uniref:Uncharacterized protein n=1 Tax=Pedobacter steynii TaxID=430522 RepID=A0A1G9L012_9SPHI|nr:DUF6266 family protein [Pedobacter steynii]NQX38683.1 hypothetical protein [Pedobacter steynii]SDL55037.1 hypothetical protein SAMN05421820_101714 [Pedobacter steynii]